MICATWNVNGLRARLARVEQFLTEVGPDLLLLQETKCAADQFPRAAIESAGYAAVDYSGGRWCGVAVLAPQDRRVSLSSAGLPGEPEPGEARWVEVRCEDLTVVSVYAPNGREVESEFYESKLDFFAAAARRIGELAVDGPLIVGGDMNVAPRDTDVWDVAALEGSTHVTVRERAALAGMTAAGDLVDAHDALHGPESQQFTWWDYRGGAFHRGHGMRIDHFLLSPALAGRLRSCSIARDFRKGKKPSDHVPLMIDLGSD